LIEQAKIHTPVLLNQVLQYCLPREAGLPSDGGVFVDGTLGIGGHAAALLKLMGSNSSYIGMDRDPKALKIARENLKSFQPRVHFIHNNYRHIDSVLEELSIPQVDGILLDIGISSLQLEDMERGFSFRHDGPLDMRMNPEDPTSAYELVNALSERELAQIFKDYGEERFAKRIAKRIVQQRHLKAIETTGELAEIIRVAVPTRGYQKIHSATRVFQALRIAVNGELEALENALEKCIHVLKPQGRIAVISFHSLEDRIVKQTFKRIEKTHLLKILTKKPIRPDEKECKENPRARSARMRVAERV